MSATKRLLKDSLERLKVDELLRGELKEAGFGGVSITKTPMGTQITLNTMRPCRVIGKRGQNIKDISTRIESELGIQNPQIAVVEVEFPELDPHIMASRIAMAMERGVHYRRALFWASRRIMAAGAKGVEITARGKLRSDRHTFEIVREGFIPKAGYPAETQVKTAIVHVKLKLGMVGIKVSIVPPDAEFPDKVTLEGAQEISQIIEKAPLTSEEILEEEKEKEEKEEEEPNADTEKERNKRDVP